MAITQKHFDQKNKALDDEYGINEGKLDSFASPFGNKAKITNYDLLKLYEERETTTVDLWPNKLDDIAVSVIIPMFRSKRIGWLAMESLVRQEGIDFSWELVVMEEDFEGPFGWKKLELYLKKLKRIGCARVKYISLSKWIPLSSKWYFLINECHANSKIGAMNSADIYCGKSRLKRQYDVLMGSEFNWYKVRGNIGYDMVANRHVKLEIDPSRTDSCLQAASMSLLRKLPLDCVKINVDGWRYRTLSQGGIVPFKETSGELMETTVNVHGLNNLSTARRMELWRRREPCCDFLKNHLPEDVVQKVLGSRKYLKEHKEIKEASSLSLKKDSLKKDTRISLADRERQMRKAKRERASKKAKEMYRSKKKAREMHKEKMSNLRGRRK